MATGLSKVQARGQVTLPGAVRRAAGLSPGDTVIIEARSMGKVQITAVGTQEPLDRVFERYGAAGVVPAGLWSEVARAVAREVSGGVASTRSTRKTPSRKRR
jgi:AbrB family looped-hinge helix DNA binding protein